MDGDFVALREVVVEGQNVVTDANGRARECEPSVWEERRGERERFSEERLKREGRECMPKCEMTEMALVEKRS